MNNFLGTFWYRFFLLNTVMVLSGRRLRVAVPNNEGKVSRWSVDSSKQLQLQAVDSQAKKNSTRRRDDDDDELELEDETPHRSEGWLLSPSEDWVQFRHAVAVNQNLVLETTAQGDKQCISDFHVKAKSTKNGNMSMLDLASNLENSHRLTLETTNITDAQGSSVQCTLSTQLPVKILESTHLPIVDWGLATHTRLSKNATLFSRLFSDDVFGQQLVVQSSYHMNRKRHGHFVLSALGAVNFGCDLGAGISVTKLFPKRFPKEMVLDDGGEEESMVVRRKKASNNTATLVGADSVELRAVCAKSGNHSLSLNANFGEV